MKRRTPRAVRLRLARPHYRGGSAHWEEPGRMRQTARFTTGLVDGAVRRLVKQGSLELTIDGVTREIRGGEPGATAAITLHHAEAVWKRVLRHGGLGFATAYIEGEWDTPDLAGLLEFAVRNHDLRRRSARWSAANQVFRTGWERLVGKPADPAVSTMVDHYNIGNEFYAAWLDKSMSYSSGIFAPGDDLESAMRRKYEHLASRAGIRPGDRVLEIGCGWGALAQYVAGELGCTVTAVTNSREQHAYTTRRMADAGLSGQVDVVLGDFREVDGEFDRVLSVEMIESIADREWPELYAVIARSLVPGGTAALQAITIDDDLQARMLRRGEFIRSFIFPGGSLPSIKVLRSLGDAAGLEWMELSTHGGSYAKTLAAWEERFVAAWPTITSRWARFDDRFYRMWRYYLAYCRAGFRTGRIDGVQVGYRKPAI